MVLLEPKGFQPVSGATVIFLAGPIHGAPPWQPAAFDLIRELAADPIGGSPGAENGPIVVASPRRFHSPEHYRFKATSTLSGFHRQRAWERHYMEMAAQRGCILFWMPGPAGSLDGMVFGATTRYEIGIWSSRYSRDPDIGLCVGSDGEFPTMHTIAYDLEHEMPGQRVYGTLEETMAAAVEIARRRHGQWLSAGSPGVNHESTLQTWTHEDVAAAYSRHSLAGNPMNDPDRLQAIAGEMLHREMDRWINSAVEVEEIDAAEAPATSGVAGAGFGELHDLEDAADLEEIPAGEVVTAAGHAESSEPERRKLHERMRDSGEWYLNGRLVEGPKYLAIGRSTYYIPFFQRLAVELGAPVYQSDYLEWIEPTHPEPSLAYYLDTAERIDVNLEGVGPDYLREATVGIGRRVDERFELPHPYMTSWEINQLFYSDRAVPVFWHTGGEMSHSAAYAILDGRVPAERIIED